MDFIFEENATVDKLEKVPEQFRGFYAQGDSGYTLKDEYKSATSAVDGLNKSLKAARKDADTAKRGRLDPAQYAAVGQLLGLEGDDAHSPDALKTAAERLISESKDGKVNWDKLKATLENGHRTQLAAKDGEIATMGKTLEKYLVTTAAVQAIAAHKGVPELLLPHIQGQTKVIREGEDYVVRIVDAAGDPRGNAAGGFMSVEDLVKEMKGHATFGRAFESEAGGGNGVKPGQQQRQQPKPGEKTSVDKIAAGLAARRS